MQLAEATGINRAQLSRWVKHDGLPRNADGTYCVPEVIHWICDTERQRYRKNRRFTRGIEIRCPVCLAKMRVTPSQDAVLFRLHATACHRAFYSLPETDFLRMDFELTAIILRFRGIHASNVLIPAMKRVRKCAQQIVCTDDAAARYLYVRTATALKLISREMETLSKEMIMANAELDQADLDRAKTLFRVGSDVVIAFLRGERKYDDNVRMAFPAMETGERIIAGERQWEALEVQKRAIAAKLLLRLGDQKELKKAVAGLTKRSLPASEMDPEASAE